jgi:hypothetical protein
MMTFGINKNEKSDIEYIKKCHMKDLGNMMIIILKNVTVQINDE